MQINEKMTSRDGAMGSAWQEYDMHFGKFACPQDEEIYDVLIVGAGITGITTALLLQQKGKRCIIVDANTIGFGTTGGTTAHLNTFFDATYPQVEQDFGQEAAKQLAQSGKDAFSIIRSFVNSLNIDCDYEEKAGIVYAENEEQARQLKQMEESTNAAGVIAKETESNHIPVEFTRALLIEGQGQFHPLKYINGLTNEFLRLGGVICENSLVTDTEFREGVHVASIRDKSPVKARELVYATHIPPGINLYNFKCAPYRSYVISVLLQDQVYPEELIYDMQEPYHYFRTHVVNGQKMLLIGGEDHKTGHGSEEEAFERLTAYAYEYFNVAEVVHKWSSQYYVPTDGLPFIGRQPGKDHTYVATGFNGNGMMFGTISGKIIADLILTQNSPYEQLFNPSRIKPIAGFKEFVKENADVALHYVKDRLEIEKVTSLDAIPADSGEIINYEGKKLAVYKNSEGKIYVLSPVCTHAGCIVKWNNSEKSWDCPCHGGRYDKYGSVLTGPPQKALSPVFPSED